MGTNAKKRAAMEHRAIRIAEEARKLNQEFNCNEMAKLIDEPIPFTRGAINLLVRRKVLIVLGVCRRMPENVSGKVYVLSGVRPKYNMTVSHEQKKTLPAQEKPGTWLKEKIAPNHTIYRVGKDLKLGKGQASNGVARGFSPIYLLD